ncbi:uncharacterized protein LOC117174690 [Belonocnema kinseyi]|uniref:uncharacterized protein LOC117174690 n=1 Tax=Belonocnema kinseyi TaxID=2817044 RepID=UPI00143DFA6F|nr:uncharacterized protein LOC117174690 [Belonocnema kinseyi]XP_033219884.1 uncharacterized protein LOC117174690 [Belonocnema kinseyi]
MELNPDILFNFAPILFTFIFIFVVLLTVFHKLKIRWPVRANCWFCNYDASIWRHEVDWWLCPSCSQYNGFSKDGDYNYSIPEQKEMPESATFYTSRHASNLTNYKNGLCFNCNDNEELKLYELRKFEQIGSKSSEKELLQFRQTVEEKYPLCSGCKQVVNDVLHKQSLWLARYKMLFFKQRPIKAIMNSGHNIEKLFRILLIIMDSLIIYNSQFWPLSIVGVILQLGICFIHSNTEKQRDILGTILWICISVVLHIDESKLLKTDIRNSWMSLEYITKYHFITALGSIIGFMNLKSKSYKASAKTVVAFKKLDTSLSSTSSLSPSPSPILRSPSPLFSAFSSTVKVNENYNHEMPLNSPVNVTDLLMKSGSLETEIPIRFKESVKNKPIYSNESGVPQNLEKMRFSDASNFAKKSPNQRESWSLNDSLHNLSTLSLSEAHPDKLRKTKVFQTQVYNTSTSALFSRCNKNSKKSILAPPKLRSVTQSWVAGGYWQAGMDPPTLSRSSSQSSGFGSAGSNLAPSREPSVYNDFDQSSVVSDAIQCCCLLSRNRQISFNPDCRFNYLLVRPANSTCSHLSNFAHSPASFNSTLPLVNLQKNYPIQDQYSTNSGNPVNHLQQVPVYRGHTTVITSPVWLPALLCGSLIFNMIVLCTILLR